jgi:hypothetical protein
LFEDVALDVSTATIGLAHEGSVRAVAAVISAAVVRAIITAITAVVCATGAVSTPGPVVSTVAIAAIVACATRRAGATTTVIPVVLAAATKKRNGRDQKGGDVSLGHHVSPSTARLRLWVGGSSGR